MKKMQAKRFFTHHAELRSAVNQLQSDLENMKFIPHDMPAAVLRLDKLYMKLLREDWQTLQTGSKVAYVPSDKYPGLSEGNLTMRPDALRIFNKFFNNDQIDDGRNRDLQNYVIEMKDLENYQQFQKMKQEYMELVFSVLATVIVFTAHDPYTKDIQKLRDVFKDIHCEIVGLYGKSDEYIFKKYENTVSLILNHPAESNRGFYQKMTEMINAITFAAPVVEATPSLRA